MHSWGCATAAGTGVLVVAQGELFRPQWNHCGRANNACCQIDVGHLTFAPASIFQRSVGSRLSLSAFSSQAIFLRVTAPLGLVLDSAGIRYRTASRATPRDASV